MSSRQIFIFYLIALVRRLSLNSFACFLWKVCLTLPFLCLSFLVILSGIALVCRGINFIAMKEKTSEQLGNFYNLLVKSCVRILLPISIIVALVLLFRGTPMTFDGKDTVVTLQGDTMQVSTGPVAAMVRHFGHA